MTNWKWKYFTRDELKCKGTGELVVNGDALDKLEHMREIMGAPLHINSAYRSIKHNHKVGGADNSMHRQGRAFDVALGKHNPNELYQAAKQAGFTGFGFYRTFLHVDTGASRWWGKYRKQYVSAPFREPPARKPFTKAELEELPSLTMRNPYEETKDTEAPHKIEGVILSDKQKITVATTGVAATTVTATIATINPTIMLEHAPAALSFLQNADYRVALGVIVVVVICGVVYLVRRWWR